MTALECQVLETLRPGGMLTLEALTRAVGKPRWLVRRAAESLKRQALVWENKAGQWQAYHAGRAS